MTTKTTRIGLFPSALVNRVLGLETEPREVVLSGRADQHVREKHSEDHVLIRPVLQDIIEQPLYVGQAPRDTKGNIVFVSRLSSPIGVGLVVVKVVLDKNGHYRIASFYRIKESDVENRRSKGYLRLAPPDL